MQLGTAGRCRLDPYGFDSCDLSPSGMIKLRDNISNRCVRLCAVTSALSNTFTCRYPWAPDDATEGGSHPPHREDDDRGSSEDDDNGANPSGGRDEDNDGDGGGLNEDGVFALVFGITVSVAICVFSAVLAFAGRERDAKVGPKA